MPPPCSCRLAPAAARPAPEAAVAGGRGGHDRACAHLVFPNLITHVATTDAALTDNQMTGPIDDGLGTSTFPAPGTTRRSCSAGSPPPTARPTTSPATSAPSRY